MLIRDPDKLRLKVIRLHHNILFTGYPGHKVIFK